MLASTLALMLALMLAGGWAWAEETLTPEPGDDAYNFVSHYRTTIDAPPAQVWPALIDLPGWMPAFELATVEGSPGTGGHVMRLYPEQEFLIQVTAVVPEQLLTIVNLPMTLQGEDSTGTGVFTLHDLGGATEVSLTLSRRYVPDPSAPDTLRETRASEPFRQQTRAMWQDQFLGRLKSVVEAKHTEQPSQ